MEFLFWVGRILFSLIFLGSGLTHLTNLEEMSQYAGSKGLPAPKLATAVSGLVIIAGGLSILFWQWVSVGSWLLAGFLLVAAFTMHDFWTLEDPQQKQSEQGQFMKNLALAGAAILFFLASRNPEIF